MLLKTNDWNDAVSSDTHSVKALAAYVSRSNAFGRDLNYSELFLLIATISTVVSLLTIVSRLILQQRTDKVNHFALSSPKTKRSVALSIFKKRRQSIRKMDTILEQEELGFDTVNLLR
uniref:AlNc14C188G8368 protein n=1 Tax=Albugo laibachii Nc14 TaxID=890382 RepID=F0WFM7_9STRA|nr:AlNc14C84G5411 [Albugo laibachii Nc14]CCA23273.1 AlNc14C188G8368 [Albugo laibachii Nc14]|eukprot:CCA23273.1 AlNc14C188G8368 [Albugo laibachii Nc14]